MKQPGTGQGWGGKRRGSGRKPYNISEREKRALLKAVKKKEKETGKSVGTVLGEIIFDNDDPKIQLVAIKAYYDIVVVKESHKTIDEQMTYRPIILPELYPEKNEENERLERAN